MIYLDTSALVKLAHAESHSAELVAWLGARHGMAMATSALAEVEITRALRRAAPESLPAVPGVLARLYRLEIDGTVRAIAAAFADPLLRSFDAIHLATAHVLAGEDDDDRAFVAYDQRLLKAAASIGLQPVQPGVD